MKFAITIATGVLIMTSAATAQIQRIGEPTLNGQRLPFSTAVRAGDDGLALGALLEVECIAYAGKK